MEPAAEGFFCACTGQLGGERHPYHRLLAKNILRISCGARYILVGNQL